MEVSAINFEVGMRLLTNGRKVLQPTSVESPAQWQRGLEREIKVGQRVRLISIKEIEDAHLRLNQNYGQSSIMPCIDEGDVGVVMTPAITACALFEVMFANCRVYCNREMIEVLA